MAMPPGAQPMGPGAPMPPAGPGAMNPAQLAMMQQQMRYMQAMQAQAASKGSPFPMMPPPYPGMGFPPAAGAPGPAGGFGGKGYDKGKGKGKGKFGKSKGKGKKGKGDSKGEGKDGEGGEGEGGERVEREERKGTPIQEAQKSARMRFEKDVLDRIQGRWSDKDDEQIFYTVSGNTCSVEGGGEGDRVFHNRLTVYGSDLCWDARRFWYNLDLKALFAAGENVETVEWNPGKDSPETKQVVWLKAPDLPPKEKENDADAGEAKEADASEAAA